MEIVAGDFALIPSSIKPAEILFDKYHADCKSRTEMNVGACFVSFGSSVLHTHKLQFDMRARRDLCWMEAMQSLPGSYDSHRISGNPCSGSNIWH